jgi:RND superfamily putative drug exporter
VRRLLRPTQLETVITGEPAVYEAIQDLSAEDLRTAESYALPFALIVLILVFGSLVAAALPVIGGGAAVATTLGAMYLLAGRYDLSIFVLNVASMLGLAVGIDYSLFIVGRFREELRAGRTVADAVEATVATAGRAVFFSGLAVFIGLLGLISYQYMSLRSMGIGGSVVVVFSVLVALTLLPALLGILGHRVNALRLFGRHDGDGVFWQRWSAWVMAHPLPILVVTTAIILLIASPIVGIVVNVPTAEELPPGQGARRGFDLVNERFDRGQLSPNQAMVTWEEGSPDPFDPQRLGELYEYGQRLAALDGVAAVESIVTLPGMDSPEAAVAFWEYVRDAARESPGESQQAAPPGADAEALARAPQLAQATTAPGTVLFRVVSEGEPDLPEGRAVAERIEGVPPPAGATLHLAGLSAGVDEFVGSIYGRFPWVIAFVVVVTYLVLLVLLRSVLLPLKAVIVNTLSILASFGALVFIFQWGNFEGLLDFESAGYVDATLPIILFCTVFGVSMDYEVFLLTRMRESWLETGDNTRSVGLGLARTGRIITSAALIIVIVAGAFAFTSVIVTKAIGVGLAVAIAVDASIIRVLLVPATMRLLGRANWWIPAWLDRRLPRVE